MKLITKYNRFLFPVLVFLFIVSTISSYYLIKEVLQNELDEILLRSKGRIENYVAEYHAVPVINSFDDQKAIFEKINGPLKDSGFQSATQFIPEQNKEHLSRKLVFPLQVGKEMYKVTISEPLEGTRHLTKVIVKIAIVTIFITLLLFILINRSLLTKIWQPFYQSLTAIKSFDINAKDKLKFPATAINEFNLMNSHFNMATENAVRDYKNLKEFSENASHEIQTPLAIIHSKLDLMVQQENLSEKQSELLRSVYSSVNKLSKLQQSLLLLTKIDNRQFQNNAAVELSGEIKNKIIQFQELWQNRAITYNIEVRETILHINKELLDILLDNLFGNATRHNIPGGTINIMLKDTMLQISNTGANQSLDPERVFKRFYKSIPNGENNGLGLSIVKEICEVSAIHINYFYQNEKHYFELSW
ncbi:sensor histidine kinase [Ferruginibacter sp. SUN106]|uniref:sensor histidine kinase n=1 Tax=Ferruginibacter sp. SUN106 TaxID=2978348 RepID=UPI003D368C86